MADRYDRAAHIALVLESVTLLSQMIASGPRVLFHGRDLTRTQMRALFVLAHDESPVTPGRLAKVLGITAGAITQLIDGLKDQKLVETVPNPNDARSRVIRLTANADDEVRRFERSTVERMMPRFAAVDDAGLTALSQTISRITKEP
ncbi:MarR family winged helix-turn-helix transcriptional regulator [Cryobacterium arcticum]|uniref:HTH marR-type domain-containing protein n=1 Tax=Cryobacterium arcticum TaxID=670052 RepID=A0A317ZKM1_9MICO|nr:helix-turn-helix domain-containing protein [Cryobacterium arcticum]PXA67100.1 hypothetical protein CTB96_10025 [Cryobacterium arcticum]